MSIAALRDIRSPCGAFDLGGERLERTAHLRLEPPRHLTCVDGLDGDLLEDEAGNVCRPGRRSRTPPSWMRPSR